MMAVWVPVIITMRITDIFIVGTYSIISVT